MTTPQTITDPFSPRRKAIMHDFANVAGSRNSHRISAVWSDHSDALVSARGMFVVDDPRQELFLPGDHDFGKRGFLRCLMASKRLLLIQSRDGVREFRYEAPIFCDTNFVSFCGAFFEGRDLGPNANAFRDAVTFLLPVSPAMNAFPYLLENAENADLERVRASLRGFAALKLTSAKDFARHRDFSATPKNEIDRIVDGCVETMRSGDFATVHGWMKQHYIWARVILLKATLVVHVDRLPTLESRMHALFRFLHEEFARVRQFEVYVAYRFFSISSSDPFFSGVQSNASKLDSVLRSMAWDLAHWRSMFELITILSRRLTDVPFPVPHFLSFDRRFIKLVGTFQLDGVIYAGSGQRCEQFYTRDVLRAVSNILKGPLRKFLSDAAMQDRGERVAASEAALDQHLIQTEKQLSSSLQKFLARNR